MSKICAIWDIDGVHYNYHRLPNHGFYKLCDEANALAARELLPHLNQSEAERISAECFERFHDCYGAFMPLASQSGLDDAQFRLQLFKRYHTILYGLLMERHPDFFNDGQDTVSAFRNACQYVEHGALSHSCMEGWGLKILDHAGVLPFFKPQAMLGLDQYNFVRKFESSAPIKMVLELMGADPEHSFFIEDSIRNMEPAAEIKGLHFVHIHHGKPLDKLPAFVTDQFATPGDFMRSKWVQPSSRASAGHTLIS